MDELHKERMLAVIMDTEENKLLYNGVFGHQIHLRVVKLMKISTSKCPSRYSFILSKVVLNPRNMFHSCRKTDKRTLQETIAKDF